LSQSPPTCRIFSTIALDEVEQALTKKAFRPLRESRQRGCGSSRGTDNTQLSEFLQPTPIRISEAWLVFPYGSPLSSGESKART
jgi:hypothetical protein